MTAPDSFAATIGVRIVEHDGGEKGRYYGGLRISLRRDLGHINRRCTLAHELAHVVLEHDPGATGWIKRRQERDADRWAANLLIDADDYAAAELAHGPHSGAIAAELEVTQKLLTVWRETHERKPE